MKIMHKDLITSVSLVTVVLLLTACGNGSNVIEGFEGNSYEEINISKSCTSPDKIDEYITLKSGDQIVKDEDGAKVSILHDENGVKKVCLNSGTAHINRAYTE